MQAKFIGNPNQPNFSYIPVTATSAAEHLGPGYLNVFKMSRVNGVTAFSVVPRFDKQAAPRRRSFSPVNATAIHQKKRRVPTPGRPLYSSPSRSYIEKYNAWISPVHFSRRPATGQQNQKTLPEDENDVLTGSPVNSKKNNI